MNATFEFDVVKRAGNILRESHTTLILFKQLLHKQIKTLNLLFQLLKHFYGLIEYTIHIIWNVQIHSILFICCFPTKHFDLMNAHNFSVCHCRRHGYLLLSGWYFILFTFELANIFCIKHICMLRACFFHSLKLRSYILVSKFAGVFKVKNDYVSLCLYVCIRAVNRTFARKKQ